MFLSCNLQDWLEHVFFSYHFLAELAGLPAKLEHERVRGREEYQGAPQAHLDPRPADVQQVPNNVEDRFIYLQLSGTHSCTAGTFVQNVNKNPLMFNRN